MGKTTVKRKPLSSPVSIKAVRWKGWGLWWEGFKEKVSFEFRVERAGVAESDRGDDGADELRELG